MEFGPFLLTSAVKGMTFQGWYDLASHANPKVKSKQDCKWKEIFY